MREVFNDFMRLEQRPDGTVRIPLGAEQVSADLAGLTDGEHVRLIYPGELHAEAIVEREERDGWTLWYAVISSMDAIRDLHPDTLAEANHTDQSKPAATSA